MKPWPPMYCFNWPSHVGGADTKFLHLHLLRRLHREYGITVVPNTRAQMRQREWVCWLRKLGGRAARLGLVLMGKVLSRQSASKCGFFPLDHMNLFRVSNLALRIPGSINRLWSRFGFITALLLASLAPVQAADAPLSFADPSPRRYEFTARASQLDPRARPHPEIDFVFERDGKPQDAQHASVDPRVPPQGRLVIWLMGPSAPLFERVNSYGLHAIRVHYANGWFAKFGQEPPPADDQLLGKIRLEAATGEDFSELVNIPKPDGMMERARQFVKWLAKENPPGRWEYFLTADQQGLRWDRVIMAGSSHGSTTAARFAKHQRVDRVVMFCGPRDQYETWQALPSATPANRFFGFTHVLDGGWTGDHYCRSWELLGLHQFGPIANVDHAAPPYGNTRRLITDADVKKDAKRAHSSVVPGSAAVKDAAGKFIHEGAWRYLFTHPVEQTGQPVPNDPGCRKDLRPVQVEKRK